MIEKLTKAQEELMPIVRDEFLAYGLYSGPTDRTKAEQAIKLVYECAGFAPPAEFRWVLSPKEAHKQAKAIDSSATACYGNHEAGWVAYYDFFRRIGVTGLEKIEGLVEAVKCVHWFYPFEGMAIVSDHPIALHLNSQKQLHKDGGPAVAYADGFEVYTLNGVSLPKEYVMEVPENLTAYVLKESNAERRRELVRRIGADRLCTALNAKIIDSWKDYQLLELDLGDGRRRPYLRMRNPSIDATHVEGVPPEIKTVKEALAWRNEMEVFVEPAVLT